MLPLAVPVFRTGDESRKTSETLPMNEEIEISKFFGMLFY